MQTTELTIRASSMPLAFKCPASIQPKPKGALNYVDESAPATLGTACHEVLAETIAKNGYIHGAMVTGLSKTVAKKYDVDRSELYRLCHAGLVLWNKIEHIMKAGGELEFEFELACEVNGVVLTGHADIVAVDKHYKTGCIVDWKSGYQDSNYKPQLLAYARMLKEEFGLEKVTVMIGWLRTYEIETNVFGESDFNDFDDKIKQILEWDGLTYSPGHGCGFCKHVNHCDARKQEAIKGVEIFKPKGSNVKDINAINLSTMVESDIYSLYEMACLASDSCDKFKSLVREHVIANGSIDGGNDMGLKITETTRKTILPEYGWGIVYKAVGDKKISDVISIGKTAVEKVIREKTKRGQKTQAVIDFNKQLYDAGAFSETQIKKMERCRV